MYYLSLQEDCVIKKNGLFYKKGRPEDLIRIEDDCFLEVCILKTNAYVNFMLDGKSEYFDNPLISTVKLPNGILINVNKTPLTIPFNVIEQQKYNDCLITVFAENGNKISVENNYGFLAKEISISVENVEILREDYSNFIAVNVNESYYFIIDVSSEPKVCFEGSGKATVINGVITVKNVLDDILGSVVIKEYSLRDLTPVNESVEYVKEIDVSKLSRKIYPFAFLEQLLINGKYKEFLSEKLIANADKLKGYFGEFIGVSFPLEYKENTVWLIYKERENGYSVKEYVIITQDKITDIYKA